MIGAPQPSLRSNRKPPGLMPQPMGSRIASCPKRSLYPHRRTRAVQCALWSTCSPRMNRKLACSCVRRALALSVVLLTAASVAIVTDATTCSQRPRFHLVSRGSLCITGDYVRLVYPGLPTSEPACALLCGRKPLCQAFSLEPSTGVCKLFEFDRCSKNVRDCGCDRRGRVFVRGWPSVPPGSLCPAGYQDRLCGSRYLLRGATDRTAGNNLCSNLEPGLTITADVDDATEMSHIDRLFANHSTDYPMGFFVGGQQGSGAREPDGGWFWSSCGQPVDARLWGIGEPDNYLGIENLVARWANHAGLTDVADNANFRAVLCECLSPFD